MIVNADDLGLHPRIDEGILKAHREGIVTSATVLVTGASAPEAVRRAKAQGLPLGVHLCLSTGLRSALPGSELPSLAPAGAFPPSWLEVAKAWARRTLPLHEVRAELSAQLAKAQELGVTPDHLDAHQHLHLLPGVCAEVEALARRERLPVRWPKERPRLGWLRRPGPAAKSALLGALGVWGGRSHGVRKVAAVGLFEAGALTEAALLRLIASLPAGEVELGCHPGLDGPPIPEQPTWRYGWELELFALCSPAVREALRVGEIELISYADLSPLPR